MASSDDDNDLRIAMALSMQQDDPTAPTNNVVVDLISDDEGEDDDEDLKRAIAMSLQDFAHPVDCVETAIASTAHDQLMSTSATELTQQTPKALLNTNVDPKPMTWDRKAMEQERLARLEKLKRKRDPPQDQPSNKVLKASTPLVVKNKVTSSQSQSGPALFYPEGTVKRTFAIKFPRTDDITLEEVLQASTVNIAVISSFQWDAEWLSRKLSHMEIKQLWIMNAKGADTQMRWRRELADCGIPNLVIHFPPLYGAVMSSHSKYMLLFGDKKLRVVVSTANMEREYWGEVKNDWQPGVLENSVFVIDLPRRNDNAVGSKEELTPFGRELVRFLEAQKLDVKVLEGVMKFDFSATGHLAFLHSIGGSYDSIDADSHPTGLAGLSRAIRDLQLDGVRCLELDYAASSLGAINDAFLRRIYLAAQGLPFTTDAEPQADVQHKFRIFYPTEETVGNSIGGLDSAGIISLRKAHFSSPVFPTACLRDYKSTRKGMLSHNKLLFARGRHLNNRPFAWVYVGSANMSESAWGAQKVLKNGSMGKLIIRNWECGVVVPVPREKMDAMDLKEDEIPPMSVFEGTIEVPFECPGEPYDGRRPHLWSL